MAHHHHHHHHQHDHAHRQAVPDSRRALLIAIVVNLALVAVEFGWGLYANSTALLADAGHNLSDVLGLVLALAAAVLAARQPSGRFTYGLRSSSILAALANAMLLLFACGAIGWEAMHRLLQPEAVDGATVAAVAAIALVVNGLSAWLLMAGGSRDMNVRAAFLHMALDAAVSLAVVIGGLGIMVTGLGWLDPAISVAIVLVVLGSTWGLLRDAVRLALGAVPAHIELVQVQAYLLAQPGVVGLDDLHIWGMSTTETALTAHLVMPDGSPGDDFIHLLAHELEDRFAIHHVTLQVTRSGHHGGCVLDTRRHN